MKVKVDQQKPKVTTDQIHELVKNLQGIIASDEESTIQQEDLVETLSRLLALSDDQFTILAPGIIQSYQQSVNNPNDKLALAHALNAMGGTAEDLTAAFDQLTIAIDKTQLSTVKRDFLKEFMATMINAINDTEGIAKRIINIPIELCHSEARIPQYANIGDSGADIYALDDITIKPGETVLVPTGIKVAIPTGYELQVRPKSGRSLKTKLRVANTPGTIDQGYRDEVKVIIENVDPPIKDITVDDDGHVTSILYGSSYTIGKGEKFAQLVLSEVPKTAFFRVDSVAEIGENRGGGFGSTDSK
jgi:dUTP pyrophosphatase